MLGYIILISAVDVSTGWIYGSLEELPWPNSILAHQLSCKAKGHSQSCLLCCDWPHLYTLLTHLSQHHKSPLTPAFLSLFTTHLFSFSEFYEGRSSTEGEKLLGNLSPKVPYKDHQVKVDACRADHRISYTYLLSCDSVCFKGIQICPKKIQIGTIRIVLPSFRAEHICPFNSSLTLPLTDLRTDSCIVQFLWFPEHRTNSPI